MIKFVDGDLFESGADALVNTINCVGVAGKGVALEFRNRYPKWFIDYKQECRRGIRPGDVWPWHTGTDFPPRYILNFATKDHWRNPSKLVWIEEGLNNLAQKLTLLDINSVAVPALGCSNGGLSWISVAPLFRVLESHPCEILVYRPH